MLQKKLVFIHFYLNTGAHLQLMQLSYWLGYLRRNFNRTGDISSKTKTWSISNTDYKKWDFRIPGNIKSKSKK